MGFFYHGYLLVEYVHQRFGPVHVVMPRLYHLYDADMPRINSHLGAIGPVHHDQASYCCCDC